MARLRWLQNARTGSEGTVSPFANKLFFRDSGLYLYSSADGILNLVSDTTLSLAATTVAVTGNLTVSGSINYAGTEIPVATGYMGTLTVGINDTGYDVKFYGATSGRYWLWDESANGVVLVGAFTETGNMAVTGTFTLTGAATISTTLDVTGNTTVGGTLVITGATTVAALTAVGAISITGNTLIATTGQLRFYDTGLYIYSSTDGQLDIVADTTITMAATNVTLTGAVVITGNTVIATTGKLSFQDTDTFIYSHADGSITMQADGGVNLVGTNQVNVESTAINLNGATIVAGTLSVTGHAIMSAAKQISFRDTETFINSPADGTLSVYSNGTLSLQAVTLVQIEGAAVTLTGAVGITGAVTMAGNNKLQIRDTGMYIYSHADGTLTIFSDAYISMGGTTEVYIEGAAVKLVGITTITGATTVAGTLAITGHVLISAAKQISFRDTETFIRSSADGTLVVYSDGLLALQATNLVQVEATAMTVTGTFGVTGATTITGNVYCTAAITSTGHMHPKTTVTALTSGATATYTAAQIVNCMISDAVSEACAATTHTATQLIAVIPNAVDGSSFWFILKNAAVGATAITLTAGVDVTITGTATVAQNNTKYFLGVVTSVASHTVTIYSVGTMVH